jgi:hypothetical protein
LEEHLIYGSDYPVPVHAVWPWLGGVISWADYLRCRRIPNILERDYQLKRAMGFPEGHFSRLRALLPGRANSS